MSKFVGKARDLLVRSPLKNRYPNCYRAFLSFYN